MEQEPKLEKDIFEIVKADDSLRTENCIVINTPEKIDINSVFNLAQENKAFVEGDEELYAMQFPDTPAKLYSEAQVRLYFNDLENKYDTAV